MTDTLVPPIESQPCTMKGHQALCCPIHSKNKKKNALFNYRRRQAKAERWFQDQGDSYNTARARCTGIDFNRPVGIKTLKPGKRVSQWVRVNGNPGRDFTEVGADPTKLGLTLDPKTKLPLGRTLKHGIVDKPVTTLRSWAGDLPEVPGKLIGGQGGAPQMNMSKGWEAFIRFL